MSCDYYWMAYKWFYNPPGLPQDLRCVGCKYMTGTALLAVSGAAAYKTYKTINPRLYMGMTFGFGSAFAILGAGVAFRFGYDDAQYNRRRIKEHTAEIKKRRRELSGVENKQINA